MELDKNIKSISPPAELPIFHSDKDWQTVSFFGQTTFNTGFSSNQEVFGIKRTDRSQHLYLVGKTGVGKTKLIELLSQADIAGGYGLCVIDPHGDLIKALLNYVPENRIDDVVIIDPTDVDYPITFNPLLNVPAEARHLVASGIIEVFKKQFGDQWTSRIEHVCRFTILALLEYQKASFADIARLLTDTKFRQEVIPQIEDEVVKRFWALEFASWNDRFDNEAIIPLVNRIGQFLSNPLIRHIFTQIDNKINFDDLINSQKIILVNLSKGLIGEDNTELFGSLIITSIYQAIMRRSKLEENERLPFYLYVDEFQNVATQTFLNLFSESRKYNLSITVSHQHLGQISPKILDTILGNIGTIISFRVGAEDAGRLAKEFAPVCEIEDLLNLHVRSFIIKLLIDGEVSDPFLGQTLTVEPAQNSHKDKILAQSRIKYTAELKNLKNNTKTETESDYQAPII